MPTAYTPILQLALPVTGELQGTWGTVVNDNITSMIEQAIAGLATINTWTSASHTLTTANGTTDEARCAVLECSGAPGAAATVVCPALSKVYVIKNSVTGGYAVTLKTSAGTGISVPNGSTALLYCDGTNVVSGATYMATLSTTQVDILAQGDLRLQDTTGGEYVALQAPATIATSYTLTLPTDDGTAGQALITDGSGVLSWSTAASGDVYGPASATDTAIATFDGVTGKLIKNNASTTIAANIITALGFSGPLNGTVGATTPAAGAFTSLSATSQLTLTNASAYNLYANGAGANFMSGKLGIGALPAASTITLLGGNSATGAATVNNIIVNGSIQSDVTSLYSSYVSNPGTAATAFTLNGLRHFSATQQTLGVGSAVTSQFGFIANSTLTGATNNYGFYGNIASGTGRYNFYANGTADNYFAGVTSVGNATDQVQLTGGYSGANSALYIGTPLSGSGGRFGVNYDRSSGITSFVGGTIASPITTGAVNASNGVWSLGAASGSESLRVTPVASAVNYVEARGAVTGAPATLLASGSDTNIGMYLVTKGTNPFQFTTGSGATEQFRIAHTASAVNYITAFGNTTGNGPYLQAAGSDTNISMFFSAKGTGGHDFYTAGNSFTRQFAVTHTASAVNYVQVTGNSTGLGPLISSQGSDANINMVYLAKGTGRHGFGTGGGSYTEQFTITHTASAVNYLQVTGNTTTNAPEIRVNGSDTNVSLSIFTKGTGAIYLRTDRDGAAPLQFGVTHTASAVNYLQVTGGATGNFPTMFAQGSDTNINLGYSTKGSYTHLFYTNAFAQLQFAITHTASAVNYLQVTGGATGVGVALSSQGSDTNIINYYSTKGTGAHAFYTGGGGQFIIANVASSVNSLTAYGSATGTAVQLAALGSDTNIDLALTPKGTGVLAFGTHTAGIVAQAGYISIKDAGGTTRRLLVG